jgi:hypothetical protein
MAAAKGSGEEPHPKGWIPNALTSKARNVFARIGIGANQGVAGAHAKLSEDELRKKKIQDAETEAKLMELFAGFELHGGPYQSEAIVAKSGGRVVGGLDDDGFLRMQWLRLGRIAPGSRPASGGGDDDSPQGSSIDDVEAGLVEVQGVETGFYQPSADDIGCRVLCKCAHATNETLSGFGEWGPLACDPKVEEQVRSLVAEGKAEFSVERTSERGQPRVLRITKDELYLSGADLSEIGSLSSVPSTEVFLELDPVKVCELRLTVPPSGSTTKKGKKAKPSRIRLHCSSHLQRDILALTVRSLCGHATPLDPEPEETFSASSATAEVPSDIVDAAASSSSSSGASSPVVTAQEHHEEEEKHHEEEDYVTLAEPSGDSPDDGEVKDVVNPLEGGEEPVQSADVEEEEEEEEEQEGAEPVTETAASEETTEAREAASVSDAADQSEVAKQLELVRRQLEEQSRTHSVTLEATRAAGDKAKKQLDSSRDECRKLRNSVADLEGKLKAALSSLEANKTAQKERAAAVEEASKQKKAASTAKREAKELQTTLTTAQRALADARKAIELEGDAKRELEDRCASLEREVASVRAARDASQLELKGLKERMSQSLKVLEEQKSLSDSHGSRVSQLEGLLSDHRANEEHLKAELEALRSENSVTGAELRRLQEEMDAQSESLRQTRVREGELNELMEVLRAELEAARGAESKASEEARRADEQARAEMARAEEALAAAELAKKEAASAQQDAAAAEAAYKEVDAQLAELKDVEAECGKLKEALSTLRKEMDEVITERNSLKRSNASLKRDVARMLADGGPEGGGAAALAAAARSRKDLQTKLLTLEEENKGLRGELRKHGVHRESPLDAESPASRASRLATISAVGSDAHGVPPHMGGSLPSTRSFSVPSQPGDSTGMIVAQLQTLANSLSEQLADKEMELEQHRTAKMMLATRLMELEEELRALRPPTDVDLEEEAGE